MLMIEFQREREYYVHNNKMQVVFRKIGEVLEEIDTSIVSALTGYSKDTIRLANKYGREDEMQTRLLIEKHTQEVLKSEREKKQGGGAERRG